MSIQDFVDSPLFDVAGGCLIFLGLMWACEVMWRWRSRTPRDRDSTGLRRAADMPFLPESVREGSEFITAPPPRYVLGLYLERLDANHKEMREYIGTAWRYGDFIVTAAHVFHSLARVRISRDWESREQLFARTYDGDFVVLPADEGDWVELHTDIVAWQIPSGHSIRSKVSSARIGAVSAKAHYVQAWAGFDGANMSMGLLETVKEAFGLLKYTGSTRAGFSGAPYVAGPHVLGMHGGGGRMNYGYPAEFIKALLLRIKKPEDSTLAAIAKALSATTRRAEVVWQKVTPDEYQLQVGGQYFMVDEEEWMDLLREERYERFFYEDEEVDGQLVRKRKVGKAYVAYEDEPEAVAVDVEPPFESDLEPFLGAGSWRRQVDPGTTHLEDHPAATTSRMDTSMRENIATPQPEPMQLMPHSEPMRNSGERQREENADQLVSSLKESVSELHKGITSGLDNLRLEMTKALTDFSKMHSENLTRIAQQVLESSRPTPTSALRWDGMDSDLQKYIDWRRSVTASDPGFPRLRALFLADTLGLTEEQSRALVRRYANIRRRRPTAYNTRPRT